MGGGVVTQGEGGDRVWAVTGVLATNVPKDRLDLRRAGPSWGTAACGRMKAGHEAPPHAIVGALQHSEALR